MSLSGGAIAPHVTPTMLRESIGAIKVISVTPEKTCHDKNPAGRNPGESGRNSSGEDRRLSLRADHAPSESNPWAGTVRPKTYMCLVKQPVGGPRGHDRRTSSPDNQMLVEANVARTGRPSLAPPLLTPFSSDRKAPAPAAATEIRGQERTTSSAL